jgi:Domain of unknown function (DUF6916)
MQPTANAITLRARSGLSRGGFLKILGAAMLWPWLGRTRLSAAAVDDLLSTPIAPAATRFQVQDGGAAVFRRQVDTTFLVRSDTGARVALRLAAVVDHPVCAHIEQFSLIFDAPGGTIDLHGTRECEHRILGIFDLFIVPIGATTSSPSAYEACFSRFVSAGEVTDAAGQPSRGVEG